MVMRCAMLIQLQTRYHNKSGSQLDKITNYFIVAPDAGNRITVSHFLTMSRRENKCLNWICTSTLNIIKKYTLIFVVYYFLFLFNHHMKQG